MADYPHLLNPFHWFPVLSTYFGPKCCCSCTTPIAVEEELLYGTAPVHSTRTAMGEFEARASWRDGSGKLSGEQMTNEQWARHAVRAMFKKALINLSHLFESAAYEVGK